MIYWLFVLFPLFPFFCFIHQIQTSRTSTPTHPHLVEPTKRKESTFCDHFPLSSSSFYKRVLTPLPIIHLLLHPPHLSSSQLTSSFARTASSNHKSTTQCQLLLLDQLLPPQLVSYPPLVGRSTNQLARLSQRVLTVSWIVHLAQHHG